MNIFKGYTNGYREGMRDAREFLARELERLEFALARAHEDLTDTHRRLAEATERGDLAADRLMAVYGREGISAALVREKQRDNAARTEFLTGMSHDPLAPVPYTDPECRFKDDEEARGDYA